MSALSSSRSIHYCQSMRYRLSSLVRVDSTHLNVGKSSAVTAYALSIGTNISDLERRKRLSRRNKQKFWSPPEKFQRR